MFEKFRTFEYTLAGRPLVIETGKMAGLANGSCLVRYGDTSVLATATASAKPRDGIDFLPLSVDLRPVCTRRERYRAASTSARGDRRKSRYCPQE